MTNHISIVGCGQIGSNLAIELAKSSLPSEISIYDADIINFKNRKINRPFKSYHKNLYKVDVLKFLIKYYSNGNIKVNSYNKNIYEPLYDTFVIDCRDRKNYINSQLEISIDGSILHLNTISTYRKQLQRPHTYLYIKNDVFLDRSLKIIINYLKDKEYNLQQFRDYDLNTCKYEIIQF